MKNVRINHLLLFILLNIIISNTLYSQQDNFKWDKELVPKVRIVDRELIHNLELELFLIESEIDYIEIFDIDGNGIAEGDLLKVYPSQNVSSLYELSRKTTDMLSAIPHPDNTEDIGLTLNINKSPDTAQERILLILATAIKELYGDDKPIKLYFEQTDESVYKFELLGFRASDLKGADDYIGIGGKAEKEIQKQKIHSLLKALYEEFNEEFITWQPTVIHVIKTEKDTVIVPEKIK